MRIRSVIRENPFSIRGNLFKLIGAVTVMSALAIGIFYFTSKSALASWFDDNWLYRKAITVTVTSSSSDITNLETLVTVDTSTSGKFQSACQDLRFTNTGGKPLPYYIDSGCGTASTKVWVMVDLVPKNTTTYNMYMYYGNPSATAASDSTRFKLFNGLVGYWTMNESSWAGVAGEVKDSSVNGNHGQAYGNATTTSSGKYSYAGTFDGDGDYVDVGNNSSLNITTNTITLSAWVNPSSFGHSKRIIDKGYTSCGSPWSQYDLRQGQNSEGNNKIGMDLSIGGGWKVLVSNSTLTTGNWYLITGVYDGSQMKIYINGVLDNSQNQTGTIDGYSTNVTIGGGITGGACNNSFPGQIDDTRIYNRALSASEITQLYSNPGNIASYGTAISQPTTSSGSEEAGPGPVAYWKFDDGQGTTAQDSSSSNNDGTISGATWVTEDQCISGKCLSFVGTNSAKVTAGSTVTGVQTVSFWVNPKTTTESIMDFDGGTHKITVASGVVTATGFAGTTVIYVNGKATSTLSANTWSHIEITTTTSFNATSLKIGYDNSTYFNGFIDDVKIYPYARTSAQIKADYNSRGSQIGTSVQIGPQNQWLSQGLVGYWKMDETSGTLSDSSGNSNTGTWNGTGSSHYTAGKFGNGGGFNGTDDYVSLFSSISLNTIHTLSLWRLLVVNQDGTWVGGAFSPQSYFLYDYTPTPGSYKLVYQAAGQGVNVDYTRQISSWEHIVVVRDGLKVRFYINGVLQGSEQTLGANNSLTIDTIGAFSGGSLPANGKVDEVRVYNRALSPKEVSDLYNFAPGPVVQLKMDESKGTSANDTSGQGRTGTLNGNPLWAPGKYGAGVKLDGTGDNVSVSDFAY